MPAQQPGQLVDAFPILTTLDCVFHAGDAFRGQHDPGELASFGADLRFGKRTQEIAAMAVAGLCDLTAVGQG